MNSDLRRIIDAVEVLPPSRFAVEGVEQEAPPSVLVEELAAAIYHRIYSRRGASGDGHGSRIGRREHLARLSRANRGSGTWDPGWTIRENEVGGAVRVEKYGVVFVASPEDVRGSGRVRVPNEAHELSPSFFLALGDADLPSIDEAPWQVRLYWNLAAEAAADWVEELTGRLNRRGVPFALKALADPAHYRRADAGVLYLEPHDYPALVGEIGAVHRLLRPRLRRPVPLLTRRLASGLAVAEGPADVSFGQHRCGLIAAALVRAFERSTDPAGAVAGAFTAAGLDAGRPHLVAGSTSDYPPIEEPEAHTGSTGASNRPAVSLEETASALGDHLCAEAFWHRDRCNWVAHSTAGGELGLRAGEPVMATLGASLWDGTAGVGLFLAQLFARTGKAKHGETAVGALRHALRASKRETGRYPPLSFYTGRLGVVWATRLVSEWTGRDDLSAEAEETLPTLLTELDGEHLLDVMSGNAGAILGLLDLHRRTGSPDLLRAAVTLGEEIRGAATSEGGKRVWRNRRVSGLAESALFLTGLSHGAAGLGLGLLELFPVTGREQFLTDALAAFDYEDALFDSKRGNWPDLRGAEDGGSGAPMTAWCHGAPGIGLARARAAAIDPERASTYRKSGRRALTTTVSSLREGLATPGADSCLCHGQCGLIETICLASGPLAASSSDGLPRRALLRLAGRYGGRGWPSGLRTRRRNPSLFLGEAGAGYTLLRIQCPRSVPSILVPGMLGGEEPC